MRIGSGPLPVAGWSGSTGYALLPAMAFALWAATLSPPRPLTAQEPVPCPAAAGPAVERGWTLYREGEIPGAGVEFTLALERCPGDPGALTGLGYVALREDRIPEARDTFQRLRAVEPDNVDVLVGAGLVAWREGEMEEVLAVFRRVEALDPGNETAREHLGRIPPGVGPPPPRPALVLPDTVVLGARTLGDRIQIREAGGWRDFWIRGMNLGAALPGRNPSEFPEREVYQGWLRDMDRMGVNTVRVYTIHPPHFYEALRDHNQAHPHRPLRLIHGVWTELPEDDDFLGAPFEGEFFAEIRRVVDLLHGRADIPPRPGHASGFYTADVSEWTLGYILGREWEPHAVLAFDSLHPGFRGYEGGYVRLEGGNAMDAWLARAVDTLVAYETRSYRTQRPVAWTNWPTLDPLHHPTEATRQEEVALRLARGERVDVEPREYDNDAIAVDPSLLRPTAAFPAGTFAAYHIYPYYPDLLILSDRYRQSESTLGPSHFIGYLKELKEHHRDIPVVIAEYGVPASHGPAHLQPQGWHHGGHSEEEMAEINRRLTLELAEAGMAGGILFAWIDEWFKKNWLVIDFELPEERNRLWYNRLDAEQHYGVFALEAEPGVPGETLTERMEAWQTLPPLHSSPSLTLRGAHDAAYLWLLVETPDRTAGDRLLVGLDVVHPDRGEFLWPGGEGPELPAGIEFAVLDDGEEVRVLVHPPANPYRLVPVGMGGEGPTADPLPIRSPPPGFFRDRLEMRLNLPYTSLPLRDGVYDSLRVVPNRRRIGRDGREYLALGYDRGVLPKGEPPDGLFQRGEGILELRIPWLLVNVTDPSSRSVLQNPGGDPPGVVRTPEGRIPPPVDGPVPSDTLRMEPETIEVEGIGVLAALAREDGGWVNGWSAGEVPIFTWPTWEEPRWRTRERPTFRTMAETFQALDPYGKRTQQATVAEEGRTAPPAPGWVSNDSLRALANQAWQEGEVERAEELYRELLEEDPGDTRALHRVALAAAWSDGIDEGIELLGRVLALEPGNVEARVDRARLLAWRGDLPGSLAALDSLRAEYPEHPGVLQERARVQSWAGHFREAVSSYEELLGITPEDRSARRQRATTLSWAQDFEASMVGWEGLLQEDPQDRDARLGLARVLAYADRLEEAQVEYRRVLESHPGDPEATEGLARTLAWSGRLVEAEEVLRAPRTHSPPGVDQRLLLATVLRWQGRPAAARAEILEASRVAPGRRDVEEELRLIEAALRPAVRGAITAEGDSDDNRMTTVTMEAGAHLHPRVGLRASVYRRDLRQPGLRREALGGQLTASVQLEPGWSVSTSAGVGTTDGPEGGELASGGVRLASPPRHPLVVEMGWSRSPLDATATLANRRITTEGTELVLRWTPAPGWTLHGTGARADFRGPTANVRTAGSFALSRRLPGGWTAGVAMRSFRFREEVQEGYFAPARFLLAEGTARHLRERGSWALVVEGAGGAQRIRSDDPTLTARLSTRLTHRSGPGREWYLGGGASTAGLQSFASEGEYRYGALLAGVAWGF